MINERQWIVEHLVRSFHLRNHSEQWGDFARLLILPCLSEAIASYNTEFQLDDILLAIIRSVDCKNCLISLDGGSRFIVFDLGYLEFIHRISNSDCGFPVLADHNYLRYHFLTNVAAEFISQGFPLEATSIWAEAYRVAHDANLLEHISVKVTKKSRLGLQARYVLLHEIGHYLINRRSSHIPTKDYDQFIDEGLALSCDETILRRTWPEVARLAGYVEATGFDLYRTQMEKLRAGILAGDQNRDELYCDCFACITLVKEEMGKGVKHMDDIFNLNLEIERARQAMEERTVTTGFVRAYQEFLFNDAVQYNYNIEAHARAAISSVLVQSLVRSIWEKSGILTVPFTQLREYLEAWSSRLSAADESFARLVSREHVAVILDIDLRALREKVRSSIKNGVTEGDARKQCQIALDYRGSGDPVIDIINSQGNCHRTDIRVHIIVVRVCGQKH